MILFINKKASVLLVNVANKTLFPVQGAPGTAAGSAAGSRCPAAAGCGQCLQRFPPAQTRLKSSLKSLRGSQKGSQKSKAGYFFRAGVPVFACAAAGVFFAAGEAVPAAGCLARRERQGEIVPSFIIFLRRERSFLAMAVISWAAMLSG